MQICPNIEIMIDYQLFDSLINETYRRLSEVNAESNYDDDDEA